MIKGEEMVNSSIEKETNVHTRTNAKVDSDLFYRSLFEFNPDMVFFLDIHGIIAKENGAFSETLGYKQEEVALCPLEQFFPSSEIPIYKELFQRAHTGEPQYADTTLLHKNGSNLYISLSLIPAISEEKVIGIFAIAKDYTDIKKTEMALAESELKFSSIAEGTLIGVYIVQEDGKVIHGNAKFYEMLGIVESKSGVNLSEYVHPEDMSKLNSLGNLLINGETGITHNFRMIKKDGTVLNVKGHSKKVYFQNKPQIVGSLQNITERKDAVGLNEYLANHDSLTDLPNGRLFKKKLQQEITDGLSNQQKFAVMMLDLDRYRVVNDTLGHSVGDMLLKQISVRLNNGLGERDVLARLGGDEFVVLLPNIVHTDQVIGVAKKIIDLFETSFHIEGHDVFVTASIGICTFPNDGDDTETLLKYASSALKRAKDKGKNTYQIFTSSMDTETYKLFTMESGLRKALELNQFELYYQPQISAFTNQIMGAEALIRWNHPEWGIVSPGEFIPIAEETGLILEIGKWVLETACIQNKAWQDAGLPVIPVSVNISAHRFLDLGFLVDIKDLLVKTKQDPQNLQIEIVETSLLENEEVVFSILDEIKKIGIKIFLDDFGTGYSSLSYLKRFKGRIDTLKIDRSFINGLSRTDVESSNFLTKTIIQLAQHLDMNVVAEGVETIEQLEILNEYNCNIIQGYIFSKPVPAEEFASLLKKGKIELSCRNK
jgi:diguanylate cyclase (GGDEF)-like protein/PAS domain S-box-containing protein